MIRDLSRLDRFSKGWPRSSRRHSATRPRPSACSRRFSISRWCDCAQSQWNLSVDPRVREFLEDGTGPVSPGNRAPSWDRAGSGRRAITPIIRPACWTSKRDGSMTNYRTHGRRFSTPWATTALSTLRTMTCTARRSWRIVPGSRQFVTVRPDDRFTLATKLDRCWIMEDGASGLAA